MNLYYQIRPASGVEYGRIGCVIEAFQNVDSWVKFRYYKDINASVVTGIYNFKRMFKPITHQTLLDKLSENDVNFFIELGWFLIPDNNVYTMALGRLNTLNREFDNDEIDQTHYKSELRKLIFAIKESLPSDKFLS